MEFTDFCYYFDIVSCCRLFNGGGRQIDFSEAKYKRVTISSKWDLNNAGGMLTDEGFAVNPHMKLTVKESGHVFLMLSRPSLSMNADTRNYRTSIGFTIHNDQADYKKLSTATSVQHPVKYRYNSVELNLKSGTYIITPVTGLPNQRMNFIFEAYSTSDIELIIHDNFTNRQQASAQQPSSGGQLSLSPYTTNVWSNEQTDINHLPADNFHPFIGQLFLLSVKETNKLMDNHAKLVGAILGALTRTDCTSLTVGNSSKGQALINLIMMSKTIDKLDQDQSIEAGKYFFEMFNLPSELFDSPSDEEKAKLEKVGKSVVRKIREICQPECGLDQLTSRPEELGRFLLDNVLLMNELFQIVQ